MTLADDLAEGTTAFPPRENTLTLNTLANYDYLSKTNQTLPKEKTQPSGGWKGGRQAQEGESLFPSRRE